MKLGVVMEGGASRTIFSCGVTDVFMDENIYPDYLIGVSAGIAFGVSYASGQRGRNAEFTEKYMGDRRYMGVQHLLNPRKRCYYNLDFAFGEIPNKLVPYDYEALAAYPGKVVAVVTNIETGEPEYLEVPPEEIHWETTVASCALPVLFPPSKINGNLYLDGGLVDPVPYKKAREEGCDRIVVILTRERGYVKGKEKGTGIVNFAYRKYPKVVESMKNRAESYNKLTEELFEEEKKGNLFVIAPRDTFGVGRTEGKWELLGKLYQEGLDVARERMPELREYLS
ncbi:MAG: patatin family protein [Clostridiales bacterium]|nr:patatin family protein [Clostridiales bacterium]